MEHKACQNGRSHPSHLSVQGPQSSPLDERNVSWPGLDYTWWRHQMETFSTLLAICAGNSPVPVNSPHKGQWRGALVFSLICARKNGWVNNRETGDLRRHRDHYDVTVMSRYCVCMCTLMLPSLRHLQLQTLSTESISSTPWFPFQRSYCPACRTTLIATRLWVVMICPIIKCLTVLEFSFILFDLCFIHHNYQFYFKLCTYCNILDIYLS